MSAAAPSREPDAHPGRLRVEHHGAVAVLLIDNPGKRNAITAAMWGTFAGLLAELAADDAVHVLLLRGVGGHFSAGADITELRAILHDPATGEQGGTGITAAEEALAAFPKATVALLEGFCVGGGWQLAGACDVRLAAPTAVLGVTPANLGILYPLSGIRRLVEVAGAATARYLLLSGELVDARQALRLGLVTTLLPGDDVEGQALAMAQRLAARSRFSQQAHKELIAAIVQAPDTVEARYADWQRQLRLSPDAALGIAAFLAKEPPRFSWAHRAP